MFLDKKIPLVAVDICSHSIVIAQLGLLKDQFEVTALGAGPLKEGWVIDGVIEKPKEIVDVLRQLLKTEKIKSSPAVTSLHGDSAIIKKIRTPVMSEEELAENIANEAEPYIPFDVSDVRLDFQILDPVQNEQNSEDNHTEGKGFLEEGTMEVLLVAALNEIVDSRFDILTEAGLRPVILDMDILAAANALNLTTDLSTMGTVALVELGDPTTQIGVLNNGVISFAQETQIQGVCNSSWLTTQFRSPFERITKIKQGRAPKNLDEEPPIWEGMEWEKFLVDDRKKKLSLKTIVEEMTEVFKLFTRNINEPIERIFIYGVGTLVSGVDSLLAEYFKIPVEIINPFRFIKTNPKHFDLETLSNFGSLATVPIGLATRRFDYK